MSSDRSDTFLPNWGSYQQCQVSFSPTSLEASTPGCQVVCLQWDNCREHLLRVVSGPAEGCFPFCLAESWILTRRKRHLYSSPISTCASYPVAHHLSSWNSPRTQIPLLPQQQEGAEVVKQFNFHWVFQCIPVGCLFLTPILHIQGSPLNSEQK